ncbi:MAG: biopolymer transporter ExbD [Candidatus Hydrogenedentota bacterium]|nr:MAG: biopolymer transporter ExbD [Candidatus Hydrogenedentota bacterium]
MIRRHVRKISSTSTVAAMADMAFLLLVFFMTATTTEPPKGVEVDLPIAKTEGAEQNTIYILLDKKKELYFDGEKIQPEELIPRLMLSKVEKDTTIALTIDKDLPYEEVSKLLLTLRENDFLNVIFMAQPKEKTKQDE